MKKISLLVLASIMQCNPILSNTDGTWDYIKQLGTGLWSALPGSDTQKAIGAGVGAAGLMTCTAFTCYILKDPAWKTEMNKALAFPNYNVTIYALSKPGAYPIAGVIKISKTNGKDLIIEKTYAVDSKAISNIRDELKKSHQATNRIIDIPYEDSKPKNMYNFFIQLFNSSEGIFDLIENDTTKQSSISTFKINRSMLGNSSITRIESPMFIDHSENTTEIDQIKDLIQIWKHLNPKNNNRFVSPANKK